MSEAQRVSDAQRVRDELVSLLAEYNVNVEPNGGRDSKAIEFWLQDKKLTFSYDATNQNVRSDLHRKLREWGALHRAPQAQQRPHTPPPADPHLTPQPDIPQPPPSATPAPPPTPTSPLGEILFQSDRVLAIDIQGELLIDKGNVLVIPLKESTVSLPISIPKDQFNLLKLLLAQLAPPPPPEASRPAAPRPAGPTRPVMQPDIEQPEIIGEDEGELEDPELEDQELDDEADEIPLPTPQTSELTEDIVAYLEQRNGAVRARVIAAALGHSIKSVEQQLRMLSNAGTVVAPQPQYWTLASKGSPTATRPRPVTPTPPPPQPTPRPVDPVIKRGRPASKNGISPQVGRIMAAMAYAAKIAGKPDLATHQVTKFLADRDAKQYAARMPQMLDKELAARGLPMPEPYRGWHHRLTPRGLAAIKELGAWPFEDDNMPVPDWLNKL